MLLSTGAQFSCLYIDIWCCFGWSGYSSSAGFLRIWSPICQLHILDAGEHLGCHHTVYVQLIRALEIFQWSLESHSVGKVHVSTLKWADFSRTELSY